MDIKKFTIAAFLVGVLSPLLLFVPVQKAYKPYCSPYQVCGQYRQRQAVYSYLRFRRIYDKCKPGLVCGK